MYWRLYCSASLLAWMYCSRSLSVLRPVERERADEVEQEDADGNERLGEPVFRPDGRLVSFADAQADLGDHPAVVFIAIVKLRREQVRRDRQPRRRLRAELRAGGKFERQHADHVRLPAQRDRDDAVVALRPAERLVLARHVLRRRAIRFILDDFLLIEALFHRPLQLDDKLLPFVEFFGVGQGFDFDLFALHPAQAHARRAGAGCQLVAQIHRGGLKALRGGDGGGELQHVLMALRDHPRRFAGALKRIKIEIARDELHAGQTLLGALDVATTRDDRAGGDDVALIAEQRDQAELRIG
jgi:hypothetical protein